MLRTFIWERQMNFPGRMRYACMDVSTLYAEPIKDVDFLNIAMSDCDSELWHSSGQVSGSRLPASVHEHLVMGVRNSAGSVQRCPQAARRSFLLRFPLGHPVWFPVLLVHHISHNLYLDQKQCGDSSSIFENGTSQENNSL